MDPLHPSGLRSLGQASMAGVILAACIFVGAGLGIWLDKLLATRPWCFFIFMVLGIVAGFYQVFRLLASLGTPGRKK